MIHEYDEIVIGSNLTAVLYAFNNKLPIFYTRPRRPFRFDYLDPDIEVSCVGLEDEHQQILTHTGTIKVGPRKELLWEKLLLLISLAGRAPLSNLCQTMRHNGQSLICSNEYSKIGEIIFQKGYYFGDEGCSGIVAEKTVANPRFICYDWIAFNRGGKHKIDLIQTSDEFVNQIWFYPTDRVDGKSAVKDACIVSHLTAEEMEHFDHSQTMARFKMIAEMKERGMKGLFNGYSATGTPKYYNFRTSIIGSERHQKPTLSQPSIETIEAPELSEKDLLEGLSAAAMGYNRLLGGS